MDAPAPTGYTAPVALDGLGDGPGRPSAIPENGAARSGAANTGSGPDHEPEGTRPMALNKDTGGIRPALDEQSVNSVAVGSTVAALHELVAAMRDNVFLDPWAVDELLDMQPSNEHAKALLVAFGVCGLIQTDETTGAMRSRGLAGF